MFATVDDLKTRWQGYPPGLDDATAMAVLADATAWLAAAYPELSGDVDDPVAGVARVVCVNMAKRALLGDGAEGLASVTFTAGEFSNHQAYRNPEGALYITRQERGLLDAVLSPGGACQIGGGGRMVEYFYPLTIPITVVQRVAGGVDVYGDPVAAEVEKTVMVFAVTESGSEPATGVHPEREVYDLKVYAPAEVGIEAGDGLRWKGKAYEVVRPPSNYDNNPWWGPGLSVIRANRVEG